MNKQDAIEFLTKVLPFDAEGEDYQSTFNDVTLTSIDELVHHLEEDFGVFVIDAYDADTQDSALVYVEATSSETQYKTPSPIGLTLKVMEAVYAIVP